MDSRPITLQELLDSRDNRRATQLRLLAENPGATLIVITVVIPGSVKRSEDSLEIAGAACRAVEQKMGEEVTVALKRDLLTGFEAYYLTSQSPSLTKEAASYIEDTHPLGRMMDIDVLDSAGNQVGRADNGRQPRRCLLCDKDARVCMRAFTHSQKELLDEIHRRVTIWKTNR